MPAVKAVTAVNYIEAKKQEIIDVSDSIWRFAEVGLQEVKSAECLERALEKEGFRVETAVAGMPTAFVATWGHGKPVIGILGEYDALPGLSQKAVPFREELESGAPGHGCGHNLLGAGSFGAAVGLKKELEARGLQATIKYFGCPAEENFSGKAFMARDGLFNECDVCITWHPSSVNRVSVGTSLANNAVNVTFYGKSSHAAGSPQNGRSALDAVQLMNIGVEFLREHISPKARIHYVITNGGGQPNVVPAKASVWYLVRAPEREEVDDLYRRVLNCAYGAAQMTDTKCEIELIKAIWNVLPNVTLEDVVQEALTRVGPPVFGEEEHAFAREITKTIPEKSKASFLKEAQVPKEEWDKVLNDTVLPKPIDTGEPKGSTDVGDVSWCCPTVQFNTACNALGTPGHSWQYAAQAGCGIGHAGMIAAAKVMAEAALELILNPSLIERAKAEFLERTGGKPYYSPMPPDQKPKFNQFKR